MTPRQTLLGRVRRLFRSTATAPAPTDPARNRRPDGGEGEEPGRSGPARTIQVPAPASTDLRIAYSPQIDGDPDAGEVVWTWVPYEEDHSRGKDRPVLLVGQDGPWLLGLQLTSQDHDRDALQEARAGRIWMDVGTGRWDRSGRPSEVRINRVIRVDPDDVRREGDILDRDMFDEVVKYMDRALDLT